MRMQRGKKLWEVKEGQERGKKEVEDAKKMEEDKGKL